ncbi:MAG: DinB family protein [bacterium]|nr:DinB family protein [bacterium]
MNKVVLSALVDDLKLHHGITMRYLKALHNEHLDWRPTEGVRTTRELVVHMYDGVLPMLNSLKTGTLTEADNNAENAKAMKMTIEELRVYAKSVFEQYVATVEAADDELLNKVIHIFYGDFPAGLMMKFFYDEHLLHRGQLSVYFRMLGIEPPFAYDFEHNEQ